MWSKVLAVGILAFSPMVAADSAKTPADFLAKHKGKVVLLNFWATWCHGCKQEIPWLVEYQSKFKREGLAVLGISMDEDGWKSVKPFLTQQKLNYPVVIGSEQLGRRYGLENMPMTVLIGRDGKVAAAHSGMVDRIGCEQEIRTLLHRQPGS
jgi:peroxiredoxin